MTEKHKLKIVGTLHHIGRRLQIAKSPHFALHVCFREVKVSLSLFELCLSEVGVSRLMVATPLDQWPATAFPFFRRSEPSQAIYNVRTKSSSKRALRLVRLQLDLTVLAPTARYATGRKYGTWALLTSNATTFPQRQLLVAHLFAISNVPTSGKPVAAIYDSSFSFLPKITMLRHSSPRH